MALKEADSVFEYIELRYTVDQDTGCWIWNGVKDGGGYGRVHYIKYGFRSAHRLSYNTYKGTIPENVCVCHKCDVRSCVNPDHLFLGTNIDNLKDRDSKGRQAKGINNGTSKLVEKEVLEIRKLKGHMRQIDIAKLYNIHTDTVYRIWIGRTWKHL